MKIKRIYTVDAILSAGFTSSFDDSKHKIQYIKDANAYLIDGRVLIPSSNIREIVVELEDVVTPTKKAK